jgi:hypothetical protein
MTSLPRVGELPFQTAPGQSTIRANHAQHELPRFEARVDRAGGYALTFSSETHHATVGLKVEACSTRAVELVAHRL